MASNISSDGWRVKIVSIPASITVTQLSEKIGLPKSHIYIPKVNNDKTHYAWINNFISQEEANKFVLQWSGSSILGETIKFVVAAPRSDERESLHSSRESFVPDVTPSSKKQYVNPVTREAKRRQDNAKPPITHAPPISFAASETASVVMNDVEKKPPSHPTSGKLSYINNDSCNKKL
jgi:hypothetical protein